MKTDLRLPMALVNTVLYVGGQFSADLDSSESQRLKELLAAKLGEGEARKLEGDGKRVEVAVEKDSK
jgi:hypothetical protein